MKKLVWVAGLILAVSIVFPDGLPLSASKVPDPVPAPTAQPNEKIAALLANADAQDKADVYDTYSAMATILRRDKGQRIKTTERWADFQGHTLDLAIKTPGKYPGLDVAIEEVFKTQVGTDDVLPNDVATQQKLIQACEIIAASAK
ncbi:hypothetical protein EBZ39_01840 [bacterium]|nr:hypothetical protein [bacterium]